MTVQTMNNLVLFLGGCDLEMRTIRELLERFAPGRVHDKSLPWGAKASEYEAEIRECLARGETPVLVELENDLELDESRVRVVDHHGARAGSKQPTSLEQVFALLDLPASEWTRWFELVAANDKGHVAAMIEEASASQAEIERVREADRRAQGVTAEEEAEAVAAIRRAEMCARGALTVVKLPHARTSVVADRMDERLGGVGFRNLLVVSPAEINFYGAGEAVCALDAEFAGGWHGGALPARGFWGSTHHKATEVEKFLLAFLGD